MKQSKLREQMVKNAPLWDESLEHDACGMGFIAQRYGQSSHELVERAITLLTRMNHRGGTGSEPDTGDGAGLLMSIPDKFFRKVARIEGITLPQSGEYAVAMLFLPFDTVAKNKVLDKIITEISADGFEYIFDRDVPFDFDACGPTAQQAMPGFRQIFIKKPQHVALERDFDDALYTLRRHLEDTISDEDMYIVSLSAKTITYKGMLHAYQVGQFFLDLHDEDVEAKIALTHSRFSTNTFPSWDRAQPFRFLAHNGEINTLQGDVNWMKTHGVAIYNEENSDSAMMENTMEHLYRHGRSIPQALLMLVPEAHSKEANVSDELAAFTEYNESFMAPWDGPAAVVFTDGNIVGARLDRNGLRPSRYLVTDDGYVILSSESGVVDVPANSIIEKGVLGPANMILVDTTTGTFTRNEELKHHFATQYPYRQWLDEYQETLQDLPNQNLLEQRLNDKERLTLFKRFGYTQEVIDGAVLKMANTGQEQTVAMGYDSPLAILSDRPQGLFTFFKQQFAQVTNPPIDALREHLVIATQMYLGREVDFQRDLPENASKLKIDSPILSPADFAKIAHISNSKQKVALIKLAYNLTGLANGQLERALIGINQQADAAIASGATILILSDREVTKNQLTVPALLAVSSLKNYLAANGNATNASIVLNTAEAIETHHFATLVGYGAAAIYPRGAYRILEAYDMNDAAHQENYRVAAEKGIVKIMAKMGISTIQGYYGAQLFEAIGLSKNVVDTYFTGTHSRIGGLDLNQIEEEYLKRYTAAYDESQDDPIPSGGAYSLREDGEYHLYNQMMMYKFQTAVRTGNEELFKEYVADIHEAEYEHPGTIRSMWEIVPNRQPINIHEVERVENIVKRFKVGAMSFGALSQEAHETIAEAMNRLGAKSNSGEGGENRKRFHTIKNSKIKQVASSRFGVNAEYLMSAEEIQIKMAQGAKPGEGGQLAGNKVFPWIAETRGSTPGVRLISPPPHHDIYSIEDLKQLIFDLKAVNPYAKINVKLVSSTGVGTIATGAVKAGADTVTVSGYDGGTGAAPRNSIRDAGLPWELGLAETHQILSANKLRQRMTLETDGKLLTGRDIAIAAMLGAEEFSFATLSMVAIGCIMMRVCHLNTCPVGITSQNPLLRSRFQGKPEDIINMMTFLAQDLRELMAELGFRTLEEMVGHTELLKTRFTTNKKYKSLDFSNMIGQVIPIARKTKDPFIAKRQWPELDMAAKAAIDNTQTLTMSAPIDNVSRAVGARMGGWIAERYGNTKLSPGLLRYTYTGSAGQSFAAYTTQGMELKVIGEANDYVGKSLSGARLIVTPPKDAGYDTNNSPIIGNVACFGGFAGEAYFHGRAGERFFVRNSGVCGVVEGVGDHGCEYMTGGVAVILGKIGRNFAAGMSGGIAYIYDPDHQVAANINLEMVDLFEINQTHGDDVLYSLLQSHAAYTDSQKAKDILAHFEDEKANFIKVYPTEYHQVLNIMNKYETEGFSGLTKELKAFNELMPEYERVPETEEELETLLSK